MNMLLLVIAGLLLLAAFVFLAIKAKNAGFLEDQNGNHIPDVVEEKAKAIKNETVARAQEVSKEMKDVGNAIKEVGKQISHVPGAIAGKRRSGKKL
jgi:hypothetical protein